MTAMMPSFHSADRPTHRRVMVVGLLFCSAFVAISFWLRPQPESGKVLVKADRLVRTAGEARRSN
uniref:Transmembrane protein n=2 Tax=Bradyrhizobium quebecense TaxID=2748629 RepID=A0A974ACQ6_9BRAD